ncbi:hypothetical protein KOR42_49330 [Thalassoglobus neptunius]|uniref:Uncharacterized protein n=1 Tax=Thalassoglobus neptunius TaxID=1938619 RepID=A0A5C5VQW3_9PLAN|nr:hypothetical protein [Thalassoglobus neptunius]TWT40191.1 hypothetical protein KOR42_49330 [Thalassoglobus neptunius]
MPIHRTPPAPSAACTRFHFQESVDLLEAEMSLHLAMFSVEGLYGRARVRLEAHYQLVTDDHRIDVDCTSRVGELIVRVFTGLLIREFGEDSFTVRKVSSSESEPQWKPIPELEPQPAF